MKEFIAYIFYMFIRLLDNLLGIGFVLSILCLIFLSTLELSGYIVKQEIFMIMLVTCLSSIIIVGLITNPILKLFSTKKNK